MRAHGKQEYDSRLLTVEQEEIFAWSVQPLTSFRRLLFLVSPHVSCYEGGWSNNSRFLLWRECRLTAAYDGYVFIRRPELFSLLAAVSNRHTKDDHRLTRK